MELKIDELNNIILTNNIKCSNFESQIELKNETINQLEIKCSKNNDKNELINN